MAKLIVEETKKYSITDASNGLNVLFSAHGVPESYIAVGDPYKRQIEECVQLISQEVQRILASDNERPKEMSREVGLQLSGLKSLLVDAGSSSKHNKVDIPPMNFHLSFQSRVGPVKWLQPYTEDKLIELGKGGVQNLITVPISFVSEHIETLEEIDMEYKELAEENGIINWKRAPALNTDPLFIKDLADIVTEALEAPPITINKAIEMNNMFTNKSK